MLPLDAIQLSCVSRFSDATPVYVGDVSRFLLRRVKFFVAQVKNPLWSNEAGASICQDHWPTCQGFAPMSSFRLSCVKDAIGTGIIAPLPCQVHLWHRQDCLEMFLLCFSVLVSTFHGAQMTSRSVQRRLPGIPQMFGLSAFIVPVFGAMIYRKWYVLYSTRAAAPSYASGWLTTPKCSGL